MESRQAVLLTKGFLSGRLDFKYPLPYSHFRERYIIDQLEAEELRALLTIRIYMDSSLLSTSVPHNKGAIDVPYDVFRTVSELALPYRYKKDKMIEKDLSDNLDADQWKAFLSEKRKALDEHGKLE